jgi:prepilin-type N-terminal cleavage/methylation domain-containing protein
MKQKNNKLSGFSFIEIMVVIAIMGIMATAGYPRLIQTIHQVRLEQKARSIFEDFCMTRDAALAAGRPEPEYSKIIFYHFNNNAANPITSYSMVDHTGESVRTVFMRNCNEFDAPVTPPRCIISSDSVCIVPVAAWGQSVTMPVSRFVLFDLNGIGYRRPVPGSPTDLEALPTDTDLFYIKSLNPVAMTPVEDIGTWAIQIQDDTYRPVLVKLP